MYSKLTKYTDITVNDYTATSKSDNAHIVVTTLGQLETALYLSKEKIELDALKIVVIDEVDYFLTNN